MLETCKVIFVENRHVGEMFLLFRFNGSLCQGPIVCSVCSIVHLFNAQSDNTLGPSFKTVFPTVIPHG